MTQQEEKAFLAKIAPLARASAAKYDIPASVIAAQAILESAWGKSLLAIQANNYFGIKDVPGDKYPDYRQYTTTEYIAGKPKKVPAHFQVFKSLQDCFDRHAELLTTLRRYGPAMKVANDRDRFAEQLQLCGYATDPSYPAKLEGLINTYDLDLLDGYRAQHRN